MITMNEQEDALLARQIEQTNQQIADSLTMEDALKNQLEYFKEEDALNTKIWDFYQSIILNYEKAIQNNNGQYIAAPFATADVVALANNTGRLYQGTVSTNARVIPEMVGGGVSSSLAPHELDNIVDINTYMERLVTPTGGNAFVVGGSATTCDLDTVVGTNVWVLGNSAQLMHLGTYTTVTIPNPNPPGPDTTYYRYHVLRAINGTSGGGIISPWGGFSNTERTTRVATSASQSLMNELARLLAESLTRWLGFVKNVIAAEEANQSPTMIDADKKISRDLRDYLAAYIDGPPGPNVCWIQDGPAGLGGLTTEITKRTNSTGPALITRSKKDKELFYAPRISYTNMRADIQSGSLTTIYYLTKLLTKYPDPWLPKKKEALNLWRKR